MTTTNTFSGLKEGDRSSSKVICPPGGRTSINLFGDPEPAPKPVVKKPYLTESGIFGSGDPTPKPAAAAASAPPPAADQATPPPAPAQATPSPAKERVTPTAAQNKAANSHSNIFGDTSPEPKKTGKGQVGFNPITGKDYNPKDEGNDSSEVATTPPNYKGRGAYNIITGAPYAVDTKQDDKKVPSTRVSNPPGGASTRPW